MLNEVKHPGRESQSGSVAQGAAVPCPDPSLPLRMTGLPPRATEQWGIR